MFRASMWPSSREVIVYLRHLVYVTLYRWPSGAHVSMELHGVPPKPACQTVIYTEWHMPDVVFIQFSWWWARRCQKHVENRNKTYMKKELRVKLVIYEDYGLLQGIPSKPAHQTVIYTEWRIPDIVLIQLILLMMGTQMPEACGELK